MKETCKMEEEEVESETLWKCPKHKWSLLELSEACFVCKKLIDDF